MFALFDSHEHLLDYIYRIPKEQRMIYKWIWLNRPARMVFDIESKDPFVIANPSEHLALYRVVYIRTMEAFQSLDIDCRNIKFAISDSTRKDKFSIHIVSNYYFETWDIQCQNDKSLQ